MIASGGPDGLSVGDSESDPVVRHSSMIRYLTDERYLQQRSPWRSPISGPIKLPGRFPGRDLLTNRCQRR
jgi:hypothetical protein